jgi:hypothetical protein
VTADVADISQSRVEFTIERDGLRKRVCAGKSEKRKADSGSNDSVHDDKPDD